MFLYIPHVPPENLAHQRRKAVERFFDAIQQGDYEALTLLLTPDAVTRWPQSGERITGAMSCVRVYENYPGGPPTYRVNRVVGDGDVWVAELVSEYDGERWYALSVLEFHGLRIARMTDYFGQTFPAPEWRSELVDVDDTRGEAA